MSYFRTSHHRRPQGSSRRFRALARVVAWMALLGAGLLGVATTRAQTFDTNVAKNALPGTATNTVVAPPAFYNPSGADGTLGTLDDDFRGDKTQGSPLLDAAEPAYTALPVALNEQPFVDSSTLQETGDPADRDLGAFESHSDALPVELASFSVRYAPNAPGPGDDEVRVAWRTLSETNNAYFAIQRKTKEGWERLKRVPGAGSTNQPQSYRAVLRVSPGAAPLRYRLRQVDADGAATYTEAITLERVAAGNTVTAYPNPSTGRVTLAIEALRQGTADLTIYNLLGQRVHRVDDVRIAEGQTQQTVHLPAVSSGQYFLHLTYEDGRTATERLTIVQ